MTTAEGEPLPMELNYAQNIDQQNYTQQDYIQNFQYQQSYSQGFDGDQNYTQNQNGPGQEGKESTVKSTKERRFHMYQLIAAAPAFFNSRINYPRNHWISTRELARRLDEYQQRPFHHQDVQREITENKFMLIDARDIKGALHLCVKAHLCMILRPSWKSIQRNFFTPQQHTPMFVSKDTEMLHMLETLPMDTEIIVYCAVGFRSGWLTRALTLHGFTNVSAVKGGVYKWANEGREIFQFEGDDQNPKYNGSKIKETYHKMRVPHRLGEDQSQMESEQRAKQPKQLRTEIVTRTIKPHQFIAKHMLAPYLKGGNPNDNANDISNANGDGNERGGSLENGNGPESTQNQEGGFISQEGAQPQELQNGAYQNQPTLADQNQAYLYITPQGQPPNQTYQEQPYQYPADQKAVYLNQALQAQSVDLAYLIPPQPQQQGTPSM